MEERRVQKWHISPRLGFPADPPSAAHHFFLLPVVVFTAGANAGAKITSCPLRCRVCFCRHRRLPAHTTCFTYRVWREILQTRRNSNTQKADITAQNASSCRIGSAERYVSADRHTRLQARVRKVFHLCHRTLKGVWLFLRKTVKTVHTFHFSGHCTCKKNLTEAGEE